MVWGWSTVSHRVLAKIGFTETERKEADAVYGATPSPRYDSDTPDVGPEVKWAFSGSEGWARWTYSYWWSSTA